MDPPGPRIHANFWDLHIVRRNLLGNINMEYGRREARVNLQYG